MRLARRPSVILLVRVILLLVALTPSFGAMTGACGIPATHATDLHGAPLHHRTGTGEDRAPPCVSALSCALTALPAPRGSETEVLPVRDHPFDAVVELFSIARTLDPPPPRA